MHLALLPLGDAEAVQLLASVPEDRRSKCWWIVLHDGTLVAGDDGGGVSLLVEIQVTRRIGLALRRLRLSPIIDALDNLLARHRGRLSRVVPDGSGPWRYP